MLKSGMKKNFIFLIAVSLLFVSFSGAEEVKSEAPALGFDKVLHFSAGFILAEGVFRVQDSMSFVLPIVLPSAAGFGKELIDKKFDWLDFACTGLGAVSRCYLLPYPVVQELQIGPLTLEYDKILHFSAGFIISDITFTLQRSDDIILPILLPSLAGAGKEFIDGCFDWRDFGYTVFGGIVRTTLRVSFKF